MKKILLTLTLLPALLGTALTAQLPANKVVMTNTGKMNIAVGGYNGVSLYVPGAILHRGPNVWVKQSGESNIGGGFYTDNGANVFDVNSTTTVSESTGIVRFVGNHTPNKRMITTYSADSLTAVNFNRGNHYIAFPHIRIRTTDSIVIPARMGIDALSVKKDGAVDNTGRMILRSDALDVAGTTQAYDASLRITGTGTTSPNLVEAGIVIVEREVGIYRNGVNQPLFPFATPFLNTQLSGYFAGNWVRRPLNDGDFGSTYYLFGNKDEDNDGIIDMDQYVYIAAEKLVPAQAYLIKPRPFGFTYQDLKNSGGLWYTGADASLYDKGKFIFNGDVYQAQKNFKEQLFAEDILDTKTVNGTSDRTVNWLIGNSYTAPISTAQLADAVQNSSLSFLKNMYVFAAGSQTYQPINLSATPEGAISVAEYTEIPGMGVLLLVLPRNMVQTGSFSITKEMLRHGVKSHGTPNKVKAAGNGFFNQINFRVTPAENANLYDLAAIGIREAAKIGSDEYDVAKFYTDDPQSFQLYSLSSEGAKLAANAVPAGTGKVKLAFRPASGTTEYTLTATNMETLSAGGIWLKDNRTGEIIDLSMTPEYTFAATPADNPERFAVYLRHPSELGDNLPQITIDSEFRLHKLTEADLNALITLYSVHGHLIATDKVCSYPMQSLDKQLPPGTYIIKIEGKSRNAVLKAIKK